MKITAVEPMLIDRYLYVQIHTDAGFVGLGESGTHGHLEASAPQTCIISACSPSICARSDRSASRSEGRSSTG